MHPKFDANKAKSKIFQIVEQASFLKDEERDLLAQALWNCDRYEKATKHLEEQKDRSDKKTHKVSLPKEIQKADEMAQEKLAPFCSTLNDTLKDLRRIWNRELSKSKFEMFMDRFNLFKNAHQKQNLSVTQNETQSIQAKLNRFKSFRNQKIALIAMADCFFKFSRDQRLNSSDSDTSTNHDFSTELVKAYALNLKEQTLRHEIQRLQKALQYKQESIAKELLGPGRTK